MSADTPRCAWAIRWGTAYATRCYLPAGHEETLHTGRGLPEFSDYQRISWLPGDRREFVTEREGEATWGEA